MKGEQAAMQHDNLDIQPVLHPACPCGSIAIAINGGTAALG